MAIYTVSEQNQNPSEMCYAWYIRLMHMPEWVITLFQCISIIHTQIDQYFNKHDQMLPCVLRDGGISTLSAVLSSASGFWTPALAVPLALHESLGLGNRG